MVFGPGAVNDPERDLKNHSLTFSSRVGVARKLHRLACDIAPIERLPGSEQRIAEFIKALCIEHGRSITHDHAGNLIVEIPGSAQVRPLIIQCHMDCPSPASNLRVDTSSGRRNTRLFAENAAFDLANLCALTLACFPILGRVRNEEIPLQLVFTRQGEGTLQGIKGLQTELLRGNQLVSLDGSFDTGFCAHSAAGGDILADWEISRVPAVENEFTALTLTVDGFPGGHSGRHYAQARGNAIQFLTAVLKDLANSTRDQDFRLAGIDHIGLRNQIPPSGQATFWVPNYLVDSVHRRLNLRDHPCLLPDFTQDSNLGWPRIRIQPAPSDALLPMDRMDTIRILDALRFATKSSNMEASYLPRSNFASISTQQDSISALIMSRAQSLSDLEQEQRGYERELKASGASVRFQNSFDAWVLNQQSALMTNAIIQYCQIIKAKPRFVETISGIELGQLYHRLGDKMEMISVSPPIERRENRADVISFYLLEKSWEWLCAISKQSRNSD